MYAICERFLKHSVEFQMLAVSPYKEAVDAVIEAGGEPLKLCYQCGNCTANCPWSLVRSFMVRKMIHQAQLGMVDLDSEDVWLCATCGACVDQCPRGVEIIDIMRALRRVIIELNLAKVPDSLRFAAKNIAALGNPLGEPQELRADWAKDLNVKTFTQGMDILYFPCCIPAYDATVRRVARATVNILNKAGVDFGILGAKELCCGQAIRKAGNEDLFQSLAEGNISTFKENGVTKIVVSSPHCYDTFKNEYPQLGGNFEVLHFTQYLAKLIDDGKIKPTKQLNTRVAYHDPCYLSRHNDIYEEPRKVLRSIPGLELVELPYSGKDCFCCGGGGGRIWMETKKGERLSDLRLEHTLATGAGVLAAACPYCISNFDDSVLTMEKGDILEIKDVSELVEQSIS